MQRIFYYIFLFILFISWIDNPAHAIGGEGVEEVPEDVIKSKGILKIQRSDGGFGTAVLFKEGEGWLAISAKHVFDQPEGGGVSFVAHLGTEQRNVTQIYRKSSDKTDLLLFALQSPFEDTGEFPRLPETDLTGPTYKGHSYGYGRTTGPNNHVPMPNSSGICRRGKIITTDFHQLGDTPRQFLNIDKEGKITDFFLNNILFSFSVFQTPDNLENRTGYEGIYEFNKSLLQNRYLPLKDDTLFPNQLVDSPCFTFYGDSGGPLIGEDNQLYGICHRGSYVFQGGIYCELSENLRNRNPFTGAEIRFGQAELMIGFYTEDNSKLYVGFPSQTTRDLMQNQVHQYLGEEINNYFMKTSDFFNSLLEQEQNGYFANWLARYHLYNSNYFVSIMQQKPWIERVIEKALTSQALK